MADLITVIAYEDHNIPTTNRVKVTNSQPRHFKREGVRNFTHVYAPSYPEIEEAYVQKTKEVYRGEGGVLSKEQFKYSNKIVPEQEEKVKAMSPNPQDNVYKEYNEQVDTQKEGVHEDANWREYSWPKLRSAATHYSEEPIKSKDQATEVMEAAERDGKFQNATNKDASDVGENDFNADVHESEEQSPVEHNDPAKED